jgi:hypothetical protein
MWVVARKRWQAGPEKDFEINPVDGENRQEIEKRCYFDGTNLPI